MSAGNFAAGVRAGIHAVESAVQVLEPSGDFAKAQARLEAKTDRRGALKKGFSAIYGFTGSLGTGETARNIAGSRNRTSALLSNMDSD